MDKEIRILIAEDTATDMELISRELRKEGFAPILKWVKTKEEFLEAFKELAPDIVLCDYKMPGFGAPEAIKITKKDGSHIPFIVVSGTIGEDIAVDMLKAGATDYIMKDKLGKLGPAVKRAIEEAREHAELKQAKEEILSLAKFPSENPLPVMRISEDGTILYCNEKGLGVLTKWDVKIGAKAPERWCRLIKEKFDTGKAAAEEEEGKTFSVVIAPIKDAGYVNLYFRDITEAKEAEKALKESEGMLKSVITAAPVGIGTASNRIVEWANEQLAAIMGYSQDELVGKSARMLYASDEEFDRVGEVLYGELRKKGIAALETFWKRKDGRVLNVYVKASTIEEKSLARGIVFTATDISERKSMENALISALHDWQVTFDASRDAMLILDKDMKIIKANQAVTGFLKKPLSEITGNFCYKLIHGSDEPIPDCPLVKALTTKKREGREFYFKDKDLWTTIVVDPIFNKKGEYTGSIHTLRDISERKRAEESIVRSEERFRVLFEFAPDAYYLSDLKGEFIDGNIRAEDLSGYNREELRGKSFLSLGMLQKDQILRAAALLARNVIGQSTGPDEFTLHRKDGTTIEVEIVTHPIKLQNKVIVLGTARDITDRKKAEGALKGAQDRLIQSEKMAAIGSFSAGIAHEVKNPLGVILSGAEFLEVKLPRYDNDVTSTLEKIKEASLRANFVLQALLQFARPSEFKTQMTKPEDIVKPIVDLMMHRARFSGIAITSEIGSEPPAVPADGNQIQQVVFNAVKNAMEAMADGGTITIRTYKSFDKDLFRGKPAFFIEINDTGHGISAENLKKLFEPFFTTKEEGKGTGLGLYISKSIVESHGGKLLVDSVAGKGTSVRIVLPLGK